MEEDNLTLAIDMLLKLVKECALIQTGDGKYSIHLQKESVDTISGKNYEIVINEKKLEYF